MLKFIFGPSHVPVFNIVIIISRLNKYFLKRQLWCISLAESCSSLRPKDTCWVHLLGKMRDKDEISSSFNMNNECVTDPQVISEEFCKYFTDIGPNITTDTPKNPDTHINNSGQHSLYLTPTDPVEIITVIRNMKNIKNLWGTMG